MAETQILFENGRIVDGLGKAWEKAWLLVREGLIEDLGQGGFPGAEESRPQTVVDLGGKTLLPGLIDAHVHLGLDGSPDPMSKVMTSSLPEVTLRMALQAKETLKAGFTTVRDLGCREFIDVAVRDAIKAGLAQGPEMICAGQMICITGGHGWQVGYQADGEDEVRKAVRFQARSGVDLVKFMATGGVLTKGGRPGMPQLTVEEMTAGIQEAHKAGLKTAAHSQGLEGSKNAVKAGIDSLEHGVNLDDEVVGLMAEQGVFVVPTLSAPINIMEAGSEAGIPQEYIDKTERLAEVHIEGLIRARKAGVPIAMGTDAGTPFNKHGRNASELVHLARIGMGPLEAIQSATSAAARLLGIDDRVGSLAPGLRADLVLVEGNPLEDMALLTDPGRIEAVYQAGRRV